MSTSSSLGLLFGKIILRPEKEDRKSQLLIPQRAAVGRILIEMIGMQDLQRQEPIPKKEVSQQTPIAVGSDTTVDSFLQQILTPKLDQITPYDNNLEKIQTIHKMIDFTLEKLVSWKQELDSSQEIYTIMTIGSNIRDVTLLIVDECDTLTEKSASKVSLQLKGVLIRSEQERQKMQNLKQVLSNSLNKIQEKLNLWKHNIKDFPSIEISPTKLNHIQKILQEVNKVYFELIN